MNPRIAKLTEEVLKGNMWFEVTPVAYDREDIFMEHVDMSAKRVSEYILAQKPMLNRYCSLSGYLRFDGTVEGDIFGRAGHPWNNLLMKDFYNQPWRNLLTFEWQHSVGDFERIMKIGLTGIREIINESKKCHEAPEELRFLNGVEKVVSAMEGWVLKNAEAALALSETEEEPEYKANLERLGESLKKIPMAPAESFYEAILCLYICYPFVPDSIGTVDRYLYPYYEKDLREGKMTREEAGALLQEVFLMLQYRISIKSDRFYRGGESHFCIGGLTEAGEDGFNDLSRLVVESLMELPTFIPQVSLRWNEKTPHEVLYFMMDCERKDPNKRIAFVSDTPRIAALTKLCDVPWKVAVNYCMAGCNEPALPGGRIMGASQQNVLRSMDNLFKNRGEELCACPDFDSFYRQYEKELTADLAEMLERDEMFNAIQAKDVNLVSAIFFDGSLEMAKSPTQGGVAYGTATMTLIGLVNVIDSLTVVDQFVYREKAVSMRDLVEALNKNWEGYEDLRSRILNRTEFFGNDDDRTNDIAKRLLLSINEYLKDKTNAFGKKYLVGNLIGYNQHHQWFGERTGATPDGRRAGDAMSFGIGQSEGKDRNGLTALLNSVACCDPAHRLNGPSVTNILLDQAVMKDDAQFEKLVWLLEVYFRNGGTHYQLNYVSVEDLKKAQKTPEKYKSLRVRVSGFSDFFNNLNKDLQDEIIRRTEVAL